ncbi:Lactose permease like protein [Verticillium longisporum]|uniref:Lactose permease like protein n=1 Tax=Verticillium longisporum TaxID=100787 RepID=A0A8I3ATT0_VERLO|nr:Lactose permease like protein [Verticillium longisporum]
MTANAKWHELPNNTNPIWYKDAGLRRNVAFGLGLCLVIATNGSSLLNGFQAIPSWQKYFKRPTGALLGIYAASFFLPSIFTSFIGDYLSTKLGRRWCILISTVVLTIGALVNTFANSIGMWCGGRAIMGAGVGMIKVATPVLIQEISHPRLRPILGSCYQTFAYFGGFFSALMTFVGLYVPGNWGWRFPSLLQILGPIAVMMVAFFCPESPRWLIKNDRAEEARKILADLHANGDEDDALVKFEMEQITTALQREMSQRQVDLLDFFRSPGNRRRLATLVVLACSLNWVGNGIISYYLAPILMSVGITSPVQITLINTGLALWNLILAGLASVYCDKAGRRPLFLIATAGMLCSYAIVMGLSAGFANTKQRSLGTAVIPFLFIYFGFYDMAYTPLPIAYTVEILPFDLRSKGMALFTSTSTLGNAFNQFVNPIALKSIAWRYYGVYIAILIFYFAFIYLMLPETKRLSAEEASRVFDFDRKGRPRDRTLDVETVTENDLDNEKLSKTTFEGEKKA